MAQRELLDLLQSGAVLVTLATLECRIEVLAAQERHTAALAAVLAESDLSEPTLLNLVSAEMAVHIPAQGPAEHKLVPEVAVCRLALEPVECRLVVRQTELTEVGRAHSQAAVQVHMQAQEEWQ